ncbi:hypothetical protein ACGFZR_24690 [Streptomyces sp. NPDC048241]|uniref:hypothetical protein n=1 Tax=Streptomyces sp. NPDC048241 TaxID=3365521 RepID=UPI003710D2A1
MDNQHLSAPTGAQVSPTRRTIAAGIIRRLGSRTLTVRATEAGVTGSIRTTATDPARAARIAELHRQCRADYAKGAAQRDARGRRDDAHPAADSVPSGYRCPATTLSDPTPCQGPVAVTVLDRTNAGADGCEYHAARLLAQIPGGRVYALPGAPDGAATRVFTNAARGER